MEYSFDKYLTVKTHILQRNINQNVYAKIFIIYPQLYIDNLHGEKNSTDYYLYSIQECYEKNEVKILGKVQGAM